MMDIHLEGITGGNYIDVDKYSGPNQDEPGSDGIWDHPHRINDNNIDRYPLVKPWGVKGVTPMQPSSIDIMLPYTVIIVIIVIIAIATLILIKRR